MIFADGGYVDELIERVQIQFGWILEIGEVDFTH
jgi:hypothetical protein